MKYLLLALVVGVALFLLFGRQRKTLRDDASRTAVPKEPGPARQAAAEPMLSCAHCGVHLPRGDALLDAEHRGYCSESHRLAGPR